MSENRVSSWSIATGAWKDAMRAIGTMSGLAVTTFLALTLVNLLPALWTHGVDLKQHPEATLEYLIVLLGSSLLTALLLTPLAIAVHRYVLLDERTRFYRLEFGLARFRRFALYTIVLQLIALAPGAVMVGFALMVKLVPPTTLVLLMLGLALVALAGSIVAIMLLVRLTLLFPAVAIDMPQAGWNRALNQSSGHGWRIFFVLVLTTLVGFLILLVATIAQEIGGVITLHGQAAVGAVLTSVTRAASNVLFAAAFVAAASRLFRVLGMPPAPAAPILGEPAE